MADVLVLTGLLQDHTKDAQRFLFLLHFTRPLIEFLDAAGQFQVQRHHGGLETAFRARFERSTHSSEEERHCLPPPHVAFLCEFDALPEIGHACGHNLIAEAGIAAGVGLQAAMEAASDLRGTLTILGTPAEEEGGGKIDLLRAGSFEGVDAAIMVHPSNKHIIRPIKLAVNFVVATFTGKAAHAARAPWDGVNALDAAVASYSSLSLLRQQMQPAWRLHAVITDGGDEPYVIPERAQIEAYARAPSIPEVRRLKEQVRQVFLSAAHATGCEVEIKWGSEEPAHYANVITNPVLANVLEEHFGSLGLADSKSTAVGGSTDMGNVSQVVPSLHPMLDIDTDYKQHTREFCVAANMDVAYQRTLAAAKAMAMTGLDLMLRPELVQQAKAEHAKQTGLNSLPG